MQIIERHTVCSLAVLDYIVTHLLLLQASVGISSGGSSSWDLVVDMLQKSAHGERPTRQLKVQVKHIGPGNPEHLFEMHVYSMQAYLLILSDAAIICVCHVPMATGMLSASCGPTCRGWRPVGQGRVLSAPPNVGMGARQVHGPGNGGRGQLWVDLDISCSA